MTQFTNQLINGQWKKGSSEKEIENKNPYNDELLFTIRSADQSDLDEAYEAAKEAQVKWAALPLHEKQALFDRLLEKMKAEKETIIDWLIKEAGSTRMKADSEFAAAVAVVKESASFLTRIAGVLLPSYIPGKENRVYRSPKGVVGAIGPWNFPFHLTLRSLAPALATGNSAVIKPASETPVTSGLLIGKLFQDAGFPDGLVNVVVGRGSEIGDMFVEHPIPKIISFTGSTEVGRRIGELAGKQLKEVALELGGNNVMIVLKDANIERAAKAAAFGKFLHQGQICMALNRIIVDESVHDEFLKAFMNIVEKLKVGDPAGQKTFVGPLINQKQVERIQKEIQESVEQGAHIQLNGKTDGALMYPTVLTNVTAGMPIVKNEIFGPVAPIMKAKSVEQAIDLANDSNYGLSGSIFTEDRHLGVEMAKKIETGMIHINDQPVNDEAHVPFGGEKASGVGRFNGEWAIEKFTTVKWISVQEGYRDYPI
ncbi:aldehyde dehydrogenase [Domibacillus antri]|uniref:3-sulfolactaldehyde dehydrogenase n=1 Tax=Domibacillus antri TaxID=1714264 RepID=A0A1Q8Q419_9BACI|nr:aldehyde dehydrogenase family protein [Domibacillus antri]OLN22089.1 aldehyde dehydrogenase [Domibacillus antri]